MLYSTFTAYLGFAVNEDEYKVMGLAAYGRPTMADQVRKLIRRTPDGAFALDLDYFEYQTTAARSYSSRFVELFGPPRNPYEPIDLETAEGQRFADCAASVQRVLEDTLVDMTRALHHETGLPDLCFWRAVWRSTASPTRGFLPSPASSACSSHPLPAMPAARWARRSMPIAFTSATRTGTCPIIRSGARRSTRRSWRGRRARMARSSKSSTRAALIERIADELAAGRIVGWMDGASEFGPRALGHRSILAAPHSAEMRDRLNRDIKYREEFRPFAPVTPIETADRYFELPSGGARLARFMSGVFPVRPEWRARLAAITHVDGSARPQTLERDMAPRLYALLEAYGRRSGIPVLLNTSFNVAGEPIVNRALEGYSTFRRCGIDALVAGPTLVTKRASSPAPLKEDVA